MSSKTAQSFDLGCTFGDVVRDKATGAEGKVRAFSMNRTGQIGVWIEGLDNTGRPFEQYIESSDIGIGTNRKE